MKTAVICFKGGSLYTKEKQLRNILKEEREPYGILCQDYDDLDAIMPVLKEMKVTKAVILHDDHGLDRFYAGCLAEYGHLIEKIECVPDFSMGLERLYENSPTGQAVQGGAAQAGATANTIQFRGKAGQDGQTYSSAHIYQFNPLQKGDKFPIPPKTPTDTNPLIVSMLRFRPGENGWWNFSAPSNVEYMASDAVIKDYAIARSIAGIQNKLAENVFYLGKPITNDNQISSQFASSIGVKAYKLGLEITQGKAKPDEKKVQEWEDSERLPFMGFLIKQLGDIQYSATIGDKDITEADGKSFANKVLKQIGFFQDLETLGKNADNMGLGLLKDAAVLIADEVAKQKEKKSKETDTLVSHPKFDEFAKCFNDDITNKNKKFKEV